MSVVLSKVEGDGGWRVLAQEARNEEGRSGNGIEGELSMEIDFPMKQQA
jgi:hypothetical protein